MDLGSGDGAFARRLESTGLQVLRLDRRPRSSPDTSTTICADVGALPFADSSVGLFTMSNLLRHLSEANRTRALRAVGRCLVPGASPRRG